MTERRTDTGSKALTDLPKRAPLYGPSGSSRTTARSTGRRHSLHIVLSIFPALVVLVAAVGLAGQSATQPLIQNAWQLLGDVVINILRQCEDAGAVAGALAIVGSGRRRCTSAGSSCCQRAAWHPRTG